eukprot:766480-Hanusia_phi.AAC.18
MRAARNRNSPITEISRLSSSSPPSSLGIHDALPTIESAREMIFSRISSTSQGSTKKPVGRLRPHDAISSRDVSVTAMSL